MYKRRRNARKKKDKAVFHSDITINDFANSDPSKLSGTRERKSTSLNVLDKKAMNEGIEQLSWFEKDLDDFDLGLEEENKVGEHEEQPVETRISVNSVKTKKNRRKINKDETGLTYPIDLWIILSGYIQPECVGAFARICKGANCVVHTVQFWKNMIRRFYRDIPDLPDQLRMNNYVDTIHGLRTNTIKLLYHIHKPLSDRIKTSVPFKDEPHSLIGQRCLLTWHKKVKNTWKFYFKFRKGDVVDLSSNCRRSINSPSFQKWHQDLFFNPDDKCSVLEVTCPDFSPQPIVMGMILNQVYFNVSSGSMRYHKIKLILDSSYKVTTARNQLGMIELLIDPVYEVRVYPWWDPNFKTSHSDLENDESFETTE